MAHKPCTWVQRDPDTWFTGCGRYTCVHAGGRWTVLADNGRGEWAETGLTAGTAGAAMALVKNP